MRAFYNWEGYTKAHKAAPRLDSTGELLLLQGHLEPDFLFEDELPKEVKEVSDKLYDLVRAAYSGYLVLGIETPNERNEENKFIRYSGLLYVCDGNRVPSAITLNAAHPNTGSDVPEIPASLRFMAYLNVEDAYKQQSLDVITNMWPLISGFDMIATGSSMGDAMIHHVKDKSSVGCGFKILKEYGLSLPEKTIFTSPTGRMQ